MKSKRFDYLTDLSMKIVFLDWIGPSEWTVFQRRLAVVLFPVWVFPWLTLVLLVSVLLLLLLPFAIAMDVWER